MDLHTQFKIDNKSTAMSFIYDNMPKYLSSKHRVHRMFYKKCDDQIVSYQNCIDDPKWKSNIDKHINESLRRKCYNDWVQVRRCAVKHMGDTFAMKLNMNRQIDDQNDEEQMIANYKVYYENKKFVHRREKYQGAPPEDEEAEAVEEEAAEEEAAEGEAAEGEAAEGEAAEGEAAEGEAAEGEASAEKPDDAAGNEETTETTETNLDRVETSEEDSRVVEEPTNAAGDNSEANIVEESSDE